MSPISPFEENLPKNQANYSPLTPLSFLTRTAEVFPERTAVIHGEIKRNWRETLKRCFRLASALKKKGVVQGTTVSVIAPNIPESVSYTHLTKQTKMIQYITVDAV